jgi:hypothetical protein
MCERLGPAQHQALATRCQRTLGSLLRCASALAAALAGLGPVEAGECSRAGALISLACWSGGGWALSGRPGVPGVRNTWRVTTSHSYLPDRTRRELQVIFDFLVVRGEWPKFRSVDMQFGRRLGGVDGQAALRDIPDIYLMRSRLNTHYYDTDEVRLSLLGIAECDGGHKNLEILVRFIEWGASIEREQDPDDESDLVLGSLSFAAHIGYDLGPLPEQADLGITPGHPPDKLGPIVSPAPDRSRSQIALLRLFVDLLPQFAGGAGWREPWQWQIAVDPRRFRAYGGIHTVDQLLDYCEDVRQARNETDHTTGAETRNGAPTGLSPVEREDAALEEDRILEEVDAEGEGTGVESDRPSAEPIEVPFNPERINVVTQNVMVAMLISRLQRGALDLQPDFQRMAGIWPDQNQSRLIESMLLRIPLPSFYAAEDKHDNWIMVDGIQRLTAMARFIAPDSVSEWSIPLTLQGLEYLTEYNGATFGGLTGRLQTRLMETQVVLHTIRPGTPAQVMFNIFARINTGGRPLSRQELRHALIPGRARELLAEFAQSDEFLIATGGSVSPARMDDREMVLRFLAFRLTSPSRYRPEFDDFLRRAMEQINILSRAEIDDLRSDFTRAMIAAHDIFGTRAFRKVYRGKQRNNPINKALFEAVSVTLALLSPAELDALRHCRDEVATGLADLLTDDPGFDRSISVGTGATAMVQRRFNLIDTMLRKIINAQSPRGN